MVIILIPHPLLFRKAQASLHHQSGPVLGSEARVSTAVKQYLVSYEVVHIMEGSVSIEQALVYIHYDNARSDIPALYTYTCTWCMYMYDSSEVE